MSASYRCAVAVIDSLLAGGVTDVVLCPGSRSAPLALAAHQASIEGRLRLHVRIDERTAGFLALGLAKGSGRCAPVVTTSGTAVGNLLPAVMEAFHAHVPLLVISADRPAEMLGTGANQTTWQAGIFVGFASTQDLASDGPPHSWADAPADAIRYAEGRDTDRRGPVHLNIAFGEPLIPADDGDQGTLPTSQREQDRDAGTCPLGDDSSEIGFYLTHRRPTRLSAFWQRIRGVPPSQLGEAEPTVPPDAVIELPPGPRTVVVCGDATPEEGRAAREFAEAAGLPLIAEPSSGARSGPNALRCGRLLLGTGLADRVERVVMFGHPTLSRPVNRLLTRDDVELIVVGQGPLLPNPGHNAGQFATGVRLAPDETGWLAEWLATDRATGERVDDLLAGLDYPSGPAVAATVLAASDGPLALGNSMAIRDADLAPLTTRPVFANRGLSGIDGSISTAIGIALASGEPATLLLGDLSFVHDANALAIGPGQPRPDLRIVVADDAGGAIFATLEYGQQRFADSFEAVFATPTGVDPAGLAHGYGVPATRVVTLPELAASLAAPIRGLSVVVAGIDRENRRQLAEALAACSRWEGSSD